MGKKLIGCNCLDQYICREEMRVYLDSSLILSPGAKDELHRRGVEIVYSARPVEREKASPPEKCNTPEPGAGSNDRVLIEKIVQLLSTDYGLNDKDQIMDVSMRVVDTLHPKK